jgi:ABC-type transporter Mla subunit MlaD
MPLTINVNVTHTVKFELPPGVATLDDLAQLEKKLMSLSDDLKALDASADAAISRVADDFAGLSQKLADLQAKVDAGLATADDLALIQKIKAKFDMLDPVVQPAPEPTPTPEPAPEPPPAP